MTNQSSIANRNMRCSEARGRWTAFWNREPTDRPCLWITAPAGTSPTAVTAPISAEDRWFDPDYVYRSTLNSVEATYYAGESEPSCSVNPLMLGWVLGCGPQVQFERDTIWLPQTMSSLNDTNAYLPGPGDPWRARLDSFLDGLFSMAGDRFRVGYPWPMCINDLLSLLRGPENLLLDLAEDTGRCRNTLVFLFERWYEVFEHFRNKVDAYEDGHFWGWPGLWSEHMVLVTQSDMSCTISQDMYRSFVCAELDLLGERYDTIWYHLDGPNAIRHLPALLERPYIRAIQYVPGDGSPDNGPAWIELYRAVQSAGKCLDLEVSRENFEYLVRHLSPEGLVLRTTADSPEEAEDLVERAAKWCGSDAV